MKNAIQSRLGFTSALVTPQCLCAGYSAQKQSGFTLIELLVVVLIIGILAAVALPQYQTAVEKSRLSEVLILMSSLEKAVDLWLLEHGTPTSTIEFLGDDANGKGQLSIDIGSGMICDPRGDRCASKNFSYSARCNPSSCWVSVSRLVNGEWGNTIYDFERFKEHSSNKWEGANCIYGNGSDNGMGEKICKWLKSQDDTYSLCEGC